MAADRQAVVVEFGRRVKDLRQRRQLTQSALARRAGFSMKFVGDVERARPIPR